MNHHEIKEKLLEFYDGELTPSESAETNAHLAACSDCRAELDEWKTTSTALFRSALPAVQTEFFVTRVMARIGETDQSRIDAWSALWKFGLAGMGLALLVFGFLPLNSSAPDTIETLLLADSRPATVSHWIMDDRAVPSDEFASYTLGDQ